MKNVPVVLSSLALIGVLVLFGLYASKNKSNQNTSTNTVSSTSSATMAPAGKIAYVDIDSLEANYNFLKQKKADFKARQEQMEAELQGSYQKMQADADEVRKKGEANTLTQAEYDAAQKRLIQMQQSLETRKQTLTDQLMKDQEEFNRDLKSRLDSYLEIYNKDKHYDFILSYSSAGAILYANKQLNITQDIIKGMNEMSNTDADKKKK